jgi:SAM-dependent methyltransferase
VLGICISTKMLQRARADTAAASVESRCCVRVQFDLAPDSADAVFSSLTLHNVHDLDRLVSTMAGSLASGGSPVFSVEHPINSAPTAQEVETSVHGGRFWPLDNCLVEGERVRNWFVDGVIEEHRTVATHVHTVIDAGLTIDRILEWGPTADDVKAPRKLADDRLRPWFLVLRAAKPSA